MRVKISRCEGPSIAPGRVRKHSANKQLWGMERERRKGRRGRGRKRRAGSRRIFILVVFKPNQEIHRH